MTSPERSKSETKNRQDGQTPLIQEKGTFPPLCGPGCSCGEPSKTGALRIVVMAIVIAVIIIAMIYRRMS